MVSKLIIKSAFKNSQNDLACYVKRYVKMTQQLNYTRREFPDGTETFAYSYSDDPGQNETVISREEYRAVRGIKEWLLDIEDIEFSDKDINDLRVNVKKIIQLILETSFIKTFHVYGKLGGMDVKGTATFRSTSNISKPNNLSRIRKSIEFKLKGYTTFTGQFSFNKIVVRSKESWDDEGLTNSNYLLNDKRYQIIQALPENASIGDYGDFMKIEDSSDQAAFRWRLENKYKRLFLVIIDEASKLKRTLSYTFTHFYELDLDGNFYHHQTRLEFSNGDNILLNADDVFAVPNIP